MGSDSIRGRRQAFRLKGTMPALTVIFDPTSDAAQAYLDLVHRFVGEERPHRFLEQPSKRGFFSRIFRCRRGADLCWVKPMAFLDYFFRRESAPSAAIAKDRLSIIVAREHGGGRAKHQYLPQLKQEAAGGTCQVREDRSRAGHGECRTQRKLRGPGAQRRSFGRRRPLARTQSSPSVFGRAEAQHDVGIRSAGPPRLRFAAPFSLLRLAL